MRLSIGALAAVTLIFALPTRIKQLGKSYWLDEAIHNLPIINATSFMNLREGIQGDQISDSLLGRLDKENGIPLE